MDRYQQELKKQLGFLRRSCQWYDNGEVDEAIRIAVPIRTIIHDTSRSTSLLTHLNATGIKLWSSVLQDVTEGTSMFHGMGMNKMWIGGAGQGEATGQVSTKAQGCGCCQCPSGGTKSCMYSA